MDFLKIFLRKSTKMSLKLNLILKELTTSTDLLTTWLHKLSKVMVVSFGLAKTMMETSSLILLLKDLDL